MGMDLFDFFYPQQAQASYLRKIASRAASPTTVVTGPAHDEIADLKTDVHFLTLVVTGILKRLAETETLSLSDVGDLFDEIDALDGTADGGLEPGVLRGLLGVLKMDEASRETTSDDDDESPTASSEDLAQFEAIANLHQRHRR